MIREVLRMGDRRLLRVAQPVTEFGTPQLAALLQDMPGSPHRRSESICAW